MSKSVRALTVAQYIDPQGRFFWFVSFNGEITCRDQRYRKIIRFDLYHWHTGQMLKRITAWLQFDLNEVQKRLPD